MAMIRNPSHTIIFGGITMVEEGANPPDSSGVRYEVMAQDTAWGNPAPVTVALLSLMRAGSLVAYDRTDNREPVLRVTIKADDSDLLAQGEKALQLECEKPNTLTWKPPDGAGEPSVFDVVWSSLELVFDDVQELNRQRVYLVRIQALPHARPEDVVTTTAIDAPGTPPTETVLYDGTSASGLTTQSGAAPTVSSGTLVTTAGNPAAISQTTNTDHTAFAFISVTWQTSLPTTLFRLNLFQAGRPWTGPQTTVLTTASGAWTTTYIQIPADATAARLQAYAQFAPSTTGTLTIDKISRWNRLPNTGTARQKSMSLIPGGSVCTQGSIAVEHASNALGKTIVYTHPSGTGYLPPLSPWRVSGDSRTVEAGRVSGSKATLTGTTTFAIPVANLPRSRVEIWAWLWASTATPFTLHWALFSFMGSTVLSSDGRTSVLTLPAGWNLVNLGAAVMPPVDMGPSGYVRLDMQRDAGDTEDVYWDEVYLFATDDGRLTVVDCGTGTPASGSHSNRLWVDAPSPTQPTGGVWRGNAADRSDQWHAGSLAEPWQTHDFEPGGTNVFVATANTVDAETSLTHYKRFHTHVARDL